MNPSPFTTTTTTDANGRVTEIIIVSSLPTPAPEPVAISAQSKTPNVGSIVGGGIAGVVVLVLSVAFLLFLRKRRRNAGIALPIALIREENGDVDTHGDAEAPVARTLSFSQPGARSITPIVTPLDGLASAVELEPQVRSYPNVHLS